MVWSVPADRPLVEFASYARELPDLRQCLHSSGPLALHRKMRKLVIVVLTARLPILHELPAFPSLVANPTAEEAGKCRSSEAVRGSDACPLWAEHTAGPVHTSSPSSVEHRWGAPAGGWAPESPRG